MSGRRAGRDDFSKPKNVVADSVALRRRPHCKSAIWNWSAPNEPRNLLKCGDFVASMVMGILCFLYTSRELITNLCASGAGGLDSVVGRAGGLGAATCGGANEIAVPVLISAGVSLSSAFLPEVKSDQTIEILSHH